MVLKYRLLYNKLQYMQYERVKIGAESASCVLMHNECWKPKYACLRLQCMLCASVVLLKL